MKLTRRNLAGITKILAAALTPLAFSATGESTWPAGVIAGLVAGFSTASAWLEESPRRKA
jgi:hypothetical protein